MVGWFFLWYRLLWRGPRNSSRRFATRSNFFIRGTVILRGIWIPRPIFHNHIFICFTYNKFMKSFYKYCKIPLNRPYINCCSRWPWIIFLLKSPEAILNKIARVACNTFGLFSAATSKLDICLLWVSVLCSVQSYVIIVFLFWQVKWSINNICYKLFYDFSLR